MTIVTPNVLITEIPTPASASAPGTPRLRRRPRSTARSRRGLRAAPVGARSGRRAAPRPSSRAAPPSSISESRRFPYAFEWPSETSQSGTNVISPNQATLRNAITPSSSNSAARSGSPVDWRCASAIRERTNRRNGTSRGAAAGNGEHGTDRSSPPRSPKADRRGESPASARARSRGCRRSRTATSRSPAAGRSRSRELRCPPDGRPRRPSPEIMTSSKHEPVRRSDGGERDPDPGQGRRPARQEPDHPPPVGPEPEERLHDRRRERGARITGSRKRVGEVELIDEERQQRRQRAVREIGREMAGRERRHRALVEICPHGGQASERLRDAGSCVRRQVARDQSPRELPLALDDRQPVPLQIVGRSSPPSGAAVARRPASRADLLVSRGRARALAARASPPAARVLTPFSFYRRDGAEVEAGPAFG